jgi:hypothetical protein
MRLGIIGLPNSGKTTVFNALTGRDYPTEPVSSGKMEVLTEVVSVPDPRVDRLSEIYKPKKTTYPTVIYNDIGGLDKTAGGGLPGPIRNALGPMDGLLHVVRVFESETVPHPYTTIDPQRDIEMLDTEFLLSDLITVERRLERIEEEKKKGKKESSAQPGEVELLTRLKNQLEEDKPLRDLNLGQSEIQMLKGYGLLSLKPVVLVLNTGDPSEDARNRIQYEHENTVIMNLAGQIEAEIAQLSPEDRAVFLEEYGIEEPGAARVIRASYDLMHILTFFTVGEDEVRGWSTSIGATAPEAAGVIHTDLQRGFIRAEVTRYEDLAELGSMNEVKAKGKQGLEGKDYVVKDGDILTIRFNI